MKGGFCFLSMELNITNKLIISENDKFLQFL